VSAEFRLLGPLEIHDPRTGRVLAPPGAKQRALLAVLLVEAGRSVSVERLAEELWGGRPPRSAANAVQAHIARLRKLLPEPGPAEAPGAGPAPRTGIVTEPGGYLLRLGGATTDAERFRLLSDEGRAAAASEPDRAVALLGGALDLWRGPALADSRGGPVCTAEADRLEERRLTTLEAFYEARLRSSRQEDVTGELERLTDEYPLRERFYDLLMAALQRADRRAEALAVYERAQRRLVGELGVEPGPSLRGRRQALLRHEASASPVRLWPGSRSDEDPYPVAHEARCDVPDVTRAGEIARIGVRLTALTRELRELTDRFEKVAARADVPGHVRL
jgi:DNA-binding SARP family transcriptional activator